MARDPVRRAAWKRTPKARLIQLTSLARIRGIPCDITLPDIAELCNLPCHYCQSQLAPSGHGLDRLDSDLGYTRDNVVPCCKECNMAKSDAFTPEEFEAIGRVIGDIKRKRGA